MYCIYHALFQHKYAQSQSHLPICSVLFVPSPSHITMSSTMERQLICPPRLPPTLPWAVSSVRAGPHYSLPILLALRLQCLVLHSPASVSRVLPWAPALSPRSTKLPWMCAAVHTQHVIPGRLLPTSVTAEHCDNLPPI